jgi:sensor histidine kinase YesM
MENFTIENTGQQLPVTSEDEAGRLTEAFNAMSKTIHELIITEYENTIKLKTMQLRQKEAQLENLRNQINPHFLYNTLDNIRIKAALGGDKETAEMIMLLVEFFRGNMEVTTLTPIAHEIKLIRIYLALMRYRYPDLEAVFEIDEDLQSIEMPGFILQPIVENSLLHGLKSVNYRGRIIISLAADKAREDLLILTVADNGKGLDTEARRNLAGILNGSETNKESGDMHIGILNVQQRLRMFYSEGCGLFFQDNPEGGVRVVIKIKKNALPISDSIML